MRHTVSHFASPGSLFGASIRPYSRNSGYSEQHSQMVSLKVCINMHMGLELENNFGFRILQGERPYWWVRETKAFLNPPELTHYPLTCETGPGSIAVA